MRVMGISVHWQAGRRCDDLAVRVTGMLRLLRMRTRVVVVRNGRRDGARYCAGEGTGIGLQQRRSRRSGHNSLSRGRGRCSGRHGRRRGHRSRGSRLGRGSAHLTRQQLPLCAHRLEQHAPVFRQLLARHRLHVAHIDGLAIHERRLHALQALRDVGRLELGRSGCAGKGLLCRCSGRGGGRGGEGSGCRCRCRGRSWLCCDRWGRLGRRRQLSSCAPLLVLRLSRCDDLLEGVRVPLARLLQQTLRLRVQQMHAIGR